MTARRAPATALALNLCGLAAAAAGSDEPLGPQKPSAAVLQWLDRQKPKLSPRDADLVRRGQETLYANILDGQWRPLRGICPSPYRYRGVWNWDGAFHAMAIGYWDGELAREQIRILLDRQLPSGALIDVLWQKQGMVDGFGKPPVMPWVSAIVDRRSPDDAFLRQAYPKFVAYARHWERDRGGDAEGLFHYDGPKPHYEAGWDDSVRWDQGCANLWTIDLNCYMVMAYRSLAEMAGRLSLAAEKRDWLARADSLAQRINERFWDNDAKAYVDRDRVNKQFSKVLTPASFMPLYVRISPPERARAMHALAKDPNKFFPGFPCVAYDDPQYRSNKFWRGPNWLNITYMALKGLKRCGFEETAETCRQKLLAWCDESKEYLWEYYDSKSGKGIGSRQYGWTGAWVIEFVLNWDADDDP